MKKTHWHKLDNPNYLGAYSLLDGTDKDLTVMIEKVVIEEVQTQRGSDPCKVAHLKGQKPMILNVTNCKTIESIYGTPYIEDWAGKKITLYVAMVNFKGDQVEALRIRSVKPAKPALTPKHPRWEGAKKAIAEENTTIKEIKKAYSLSAENENKLQSE